MAWRYRFGAGFRLSHVFDIIAEEYQERGTLLPEDTTEIVNA
jgi:hypothetical protein